MGGRRACARLRAPNGHHAPRRAPTSPPCSPAPPAAAAGSCHSQSPGLIGGARRSARTGAAHTWCLLQRGGGWGRLQPWASSRRGPRPNGSMGSRRAVCIHRMHARCVALAPAQPHTCCRGPLLALPFILFIIVEVVHPALPSARAAVHQWHDGGSPSLATATRPRRSPVNHARAPRHCFHCHGSVGGRGWRWSPDGRGRQRQPNFSAPQQRFLVPATQCSE